MFGFSFNGQPTKKHTTLKTRWQFYRNIITCAYAYTFQCDVHVYTHTKPSNHPSMVHGWERDADINPKNKHYNGWVCPKTNSTGKMHVCHFYGFICLFIRWMGLDGFFSGWSMHFFFFYQFISQFIRLQWLQCAFIEFNGWVWCTANAMFCNKT